MFDFVFHALLDFRVGTIQQDFVPRVKGLNLFPGNFPLHGNAADGDDMAENFDTEFVQKKFGESADGDPGRRFAGGGTLENVAGLGKIVFESAGEVGVSGTRRGDALVEGRISLGDRERFLPVFPVTIFELDGDGRADGDAVANAGEDVGRVALDLHAPAAAIALLAAPEFAVQKSLVYFESGRQS